MEENKIVDETQAVIEQINALPEEEKNALIAEIEKLAEKPEVPAKGIAAIKAGSAPGRKLRGVGVTRKNKEVGKKARKMSKNSRRRNRS